jgi:HEAT repeat protein
MRSPRVVRSLLVALALSPSAHAAADVPGLVNARAETHMIASSLVREMPAILGSHPGPFWMGYAVPASGKHRTCCWSSSEEGGCGGCRLEGDGAQGSFQKNRAEPVPLEGAARMRVLLRAEGGQVTRVRIVSEDCGLDAGGLSFVWVEGVRAGDSVAFLTSLLGSSREVGRRLEDGALSAIAFTDDPAADAALIEVARHDVRGRVRGQALFWLAQAASRRAGPAIQAAVDDDPEIEVKKKAVFALSQLPKDEGVPLLIRLAETHKSVEVRKQAMFWLGQSQDARALQFFEDVLKR